MSPAFPSVPEKERLTEFEGTSAEEGDDGEELRVNKIDIEEQLRATIRNLAYCGEKLGTFARGLHIYDCCRVKG